MALNLVMTIVLIHLLQWVRDAWRFVRLEAENMAQMARRHSPSIARSLQLRHSDDWRPLIANVPDVFLRIAVGEVIFSIQNVMDLSYEIIRVLYPEFTIITMFFLGFFIHFALLLGLALVAFSCAVPRLTGSNRREAVDTSVEIWRLLQRLWHWPRAGFFLTDYQHVVEEVVICIAELCRDSD